VRYSKAYSIADLYSYNVCELPLYSIYVHPFSHETININLSKKPEWYLEKITSLGKVPAIQLDDKIIYDSVIINDYIDQTYPGVKLTPSDPYQAAQDRMLLERWSSKVSTRYYMQSNRTVLFCNQSTESTKLFTNTPL